MTPEEEVELRKRIQGMGECRVQVRIDERDYIPTYKIIGLILEERERFAEAEKRASRLRHLLRLAREWVAADKAIPAPELTRDIDEALKCSKCGWNHRPEKLCTALTRPGAGAGDW